MHGNHRQRGQQRQVTHFGGIIGAAALSVGAVPAMASVVPLLCLFTTDCAGQDDACQPDTFTIEIAAIDHEPGLWFVYDGIMAPVRDVTPQDAMTQTFLTLGHADREAVTVFQTGEAIHIRQYYQPGRGPVQRTAFGQCEVL